jgi:hypothetical protein
MSYDFSLRRWITFGCCILVWIACGGLSQFGIHGLIQLDMERLSRAGVRFCGLFFVGAGLASFVDHYVGHMPPSNLRPVYVIIGALMMAIAIMLLMSLRINP